VSAPISVKRRTRRSSERPSPHGRRDTRLSLSLGCSIFPCSYALNSQSAFHTSCQTSRQPTPTPMSTIAPFDIASHTAPLTEHHPFPPLPLLQERSTKSHLMILRRRPATAQLRHLSILYSSQSSFHLAEQFISAYLVGSITIIMASIFYPEHSSARLAHI